jgi:hypothetical protein
LANLRLLFAYKPKTRVENVNVIEIPMRHYVPLLELHLYAGRLKGTTKGKPERARALKVQGLTIAEIANAMAVSKRTVFRYLSQK